MSCERYADALLEHALGEPAPLELESHLRCCAACRGALERERRLLGKIDGELRDAVSVSPSPELLPRVRERLANAAAARSWGVSWLIPVAAGAATLALAAWLLQTVQPPSSPAARVEPRRESPAPPAGVTEAPRRPEAAGFARASKEPFVTRRAEPEVLVPAAEEAALLHFMATIRAGRVDASALVQAAAPPPPDLGIAPLVELPALEVKPLTAEGNSEGVDQ